MAKTAYPRQMAVTPQRGRDRSPVVFTVIGPVSETTSENWKKYEPDFTGKTLQLVESAERVEDAKRKNWPVTTDPASMDRELKRQIARLSGSVHDQPMEHEIVDVADEPGPATYETHNPDDVGGAMPATKALKAKRAKATAGMTADVADVVAQLAPKAKRASKTAPAPAPVTVAVASAGIERVTNRAALLRALSGKGPVAAPVAVAPAPAVVVAKVAKVAPAPAPVAVAVAIVGDDYTGACIVW